MSIGDPSPDAYFFVIDAEDGTKYDAHFDINQIGDDYYGDVRYRPYQSGPETPWVFLSPAGDVQFDSSKMKEKIFADIEIQTVMTAFNKGIENAFGVFNGTPTEAPESGIERALYMIRNNKISESNNVLTYNPDD